MYSCLNWGYNNNTNNLYRNKKDDEWFYYYDRLKRSPLSWREECINTAQYIRETTDLPIEILVSGGVDSLCCCESFRKAGIPFTALTFDFKYNRHDIMYAKDYCKYHGIKQRIKTINIKTFFEKFLIEYSEYTQCRNPQIVFLSWMIEYSDGFPVFGLGEIFLCLGRSKNSKFGYIQAPINEGKVLTFEGEQYQAIERMLKYRNRQGATKFFSYTSELKVSTLINPILLEWIKYAKINKWQDTDSYYQKIKSNFKNLFYLHYFPSVGTRPPIKYKRFKGTPKIIERNDYTGFEYVSDIHRVYQDILFKKYPLEYNQFSWIPYIEKLKDICKDNILSTVENIEKYLSNKGEKK